MSDKENPIREGKADGINPKEVGVTPSAKELKAQEKPDIKESELGREISQEPADAPIEPGNSQIDDATIELQKKRAAGNQSDSEKRP